MQFKVSFTNLSMSATVGMKCETIVEVRVVLRFSRKSNLLLVSGVAPCHQVLLFTFIPLNYAHLQLKVNSFI